MESSLEQKLSMGLGKRRGNSDTQKVCSCIYSNTFLGNNHYFCIRVEEMKNTVNKLNVKDRN
jgi:hypothetical protein